MNMQEKALNRKSLNICNKRELAYVLVVITFGTFIFLLNSPVHPFVEGCTGTDSSVFKTIALMMERGHMPYRDSFDHKGPLLYILNFVGNQISYYTGIWLIEFIFLLITFYTMYRIARLFCNMWQSLFTLFVALIPLFTYFEGGNLTEEYAMAFIAVSTIIFIDFFENQKITCLRLALCGASFAGTLLLRPNMIALWVVMCLAVLIKSIIEKSGIELCKYIGCFLLGMVLIILPIVFWLSKNDSLKSFWEDYIVFNRQYVSATGGTTTIKKLFMSFIHFACSPVYLISMFLQLRLNIKKRSVFNIANSLLFIVNLVFICISGMTFEHYGMILIPSIIYPIAKTFQEINLFDIDNQIKKRLYELCAIVFVGLGLGSCILFGGHGLMNCVRKVTGSNISQDVKEICKTLDDFGIGEDEPISVYGNYNIIYVLSKRPHATTYSYQFPIGQVKPSIIDEYFQQLKETLPRAVVIQAGMKDDNILGFLESNDYKLVWIDCGTSNREEESAELYIR